MSFWWSLIGHGQLVSPPILAQLEEDRSAPSKVLEMLVKFRGMPCLDPLTGEAVGSMVEVWTWWGVSCAGQTEAWSAHTPWHELSDMSH